MAETLQDYYDKMGLKDPMSPTPSVTPEQPMASETLDPEQPYRYQGDTAPTHEDVERIAQSKYNISSHNALMGTLVSAGVEIGSGIGGTVYATKIANKLKWINRAKNAALAGVVTPEPTSTVAGLVAFGATEAAIWGFSNFLGQTARKKFGIQEHYSGGEMVAAAVFGTAAASAQATKLIELGPSLASMKAWKSAPIARETGKAFISGAALGVAESLLRQEIQLVLNERENRDVFDYMFSGVAGGGFNTVFSVFGRTGAWGLYKAADSADNARKIAEQKLEQAHKITSSRKRNKEVKKWSDALQVLDEIETSFRGAGDAEIELRNKAPEPEHINNPTGDHRQAPKLEPLAPPTEQPKFPENGESTTVNREGEAPEIDKTTATTPETEAPENPFDKMSYKELQAEAKKQGIKANLKKEELKKQLGAKPQETPSKPQSPTEEAKPQLTVRQEQIERLKERFVAIKGDPRLGIDMPRLEMDSNQLKTELSDDVDWRVEELTAKYQRGEELDPTEFDDFLELVSDLRSLNEVDNVLKAASGRGGQANRTDAERFVTDSEISIRAIREDAALYDMEEAFKKLRAGDDVPDLEKQLEDILGEVENTKLESEAVFGGKKLSDEELEKLGITREEMEIRQKTQKLIPVAMKALTRQLNTERAKMMEGMKTAMNQTQKDAMAKEVKKRLKENPHIQLLEEQLKYYKAADTELKQIEKGQIELARLTNLEADGTLGQQRAEFTKKPTFKKEVNVQVAELRKLIADSKGRMRSKVKDIDRAHKEMAKFDLFMSMQSHAMRNLEMDSSNKLIQFGRDVRTARKLALIDQIPSIMAGVPTGVGLAMRSALRPFVMAPIDFARFGKDQGTALAKAEFKGVAEAILNWSGTLTSMGRTFMKGQSATDQVMSKYLEESSSKAIRMGNNPTISRAMKTAEARLKGKKDPMNTILDFKNGGGWALLSLGVRGISAVDDGFRRQLLRGRLDTAARRKAILEQPDNPLKQQEAYDGYVKTMWRDQDGLQVLNNYREYIDDVNDINQNLLFAAQHEDPNMFHQNMGEQLIKAIQKEAKGDSTLAYTIDAFMPYISVPLRGVYRGARFAAAPAVALRSVTPMNPYTQKIKERVSRINEGQNALLKLDQSDPLYKTTAEHVKRAQDEIITLEQRQTKYREDALVDAAFGMGLTYLGAEAAGMGDATGSLNWLSEDQKEKNKLKPFQLFGMDYSAAAPWAIPIAIGADIAAYLSAREAGILEEHQSIPWMISTAVKDITEQTPMFEGFKTFNAILAGGMDAKAQQVGRMAVGYIPLPAQVRKTIMAATEDETLGDLRGGTFGQRTAYAFFGIKPVNRKTDYFGEDVKSGKTWVQHTIIRQAPHKNEGLNSEFERVLASDVYDNIQAVPSSLGHRLKMTSFIDEEGVTLQYAFARRLREKRLPYRGKKRTLQDAVNKLISSKKWRKKHEEATVSKSLMYTNEGLRELNTLMQDYYKAVRADIIKDDDFTKRFVNAKDEFLYDLVRREDLKVLGNVTPLRELLQKK